MHRRYQHLSRIERGKIMYLETWDLSVSQMAIELGRDKSTVSRELRRNRQLLVEYYLDESAQARADRRRKQASQGYRLKNRRIRSYVEGKLRGGWSPEIVAGRIKLDLPGCSISHEAIYQYVYQLDEPKRGEYIKYPHLNHRRRRERSNTKSPRKSRIPNRISIDERPVAVEGRQQAGHWEGDSMVLSRSSVVLYSLVERKTRLVKLVRVWGRDGKRTAEAIISRLGALPKKGRRTLTMDNGFEHTRHEMITAAIGIRCYFCDPYSAWQRGTNENRNGMVRRYSPKDTDFSKLTEVEIRRVELTINNRPMKCLGYRTPLQLPHALLHFDVERGRVT